MTHRPTLAAAAALLAWAAAPAPAQEDCAARPTQAEVTRCAEAAWRSADEALAPALEEALAAAERADFRDDGRPRQMLEAAQAAWTASRDATCAAEAQLLEPGTGAAPARFACLERLSRARLDDLRTFVGLAPSP